MKVNKIGNYIHYRYSNYLKYGLGINKKLASSQTANQVFKAHEKQLKTLLKQRTSKNKEKIKDKLEKQMNFFFNPKNSKKVIEDTQADDLKKKVILIFKQIMENKGIDISKVNIDYDRLLAEGGQIVTIDDSGTKIELAKERKTRLGREGQKTTTYSAVVRRVQELIALRNNLIESASLTDNDNKFITAVNNLETQYEKLINEFKQAITDSQGNLSIVKQQGKKGVKIAGSMARVNITQGTEADFVKSVQALMDMTVQTTNTMITGYLGEYIPVISQQLFQIAATRGIKECLNFLDIDLITGKVLGDERSRKILRKEFVINRKDSSHSIDAQIGNVKIRSNYTQDKVDIVLDIDKHNKINASVKNVNLHSGHNISLLSGTSLLNILQDYQLFTNHYLNITSTIGRSPDDKKPNNILLQRAHDLAKLTLVTHSFMGYVWGADKNGNIDHTKKAEIFVVNDTSQTKGYFKVYFISDLLDKIWQNINLANVEDFNTIKEYKNEFLGEQQDKNIPAAFARIAKILTELHKMKLEVSVSPQILQNF